MAVKPLHPITSRSSVLNPPAESSCSILLLDPPALSPSSVLPRPWSYRRILAPSLAELLLTQAGLGGRSNAPGLPYQDSDHLPRFGSEGWSRAHEIEPAQQWSLRNLGEAGWTPFILIPRPDIWRKLIAGATMYGRSRSSAKRWIFREQHSFWKDRGLSRMVGSGMSLLQASTQRLPWSHDLVLEVTRHLRLSWNTGMIIEGIDAWIAELIVYGNSYRDRYHQNRSKLANEGIELMG